VNGPPSPPKPHPTRPACAQGVEALAQRQPPALPPLADRGSAPGVLTRTVSTLLAPQKRWVWRLALAALVVVIAVLALAPAESVSAPGSDKLHHVLAFAALMFVGGLALRPGAARLTGMALVLIGYGLLIELVQLQIEGRYGSLDDWLADAFGIGLGLIAVLLVRRRMGASAIAGD
jgi:VanZ family protein